MDNPQQKSNREHSFDSELASLVGIEKAILLKNISYWVDENERKKLESSFAYGKWWTFESLTSLAKKYPYMKRGNLSRWFKELKQDKWILMFSTTDGANMYTPGPVFNSWNLGQDFKGVFQNETGRAWGELFQNETKAEFQNETKGAAQNETHNNVEKDIEKNVELEGEREDEKTTPTLEDVIEEIKNRNAETRDVEAKKEKAPSIADGFPKLDISEEIDELKNGVVRRGNSSPVLVQSFDPATLPGAMIRTAEVIEPSKPLPVSLRARPNAETPAELKAAMSVFYHERPFEWNDGVLKLSHGERYSTTKQVEIVTDWCCHVIKENRGGLTYGQLNADLQKWFRNQPTAEGWKSPNGQKPEKADFYVRPPKVEKTPAYTP